ncbi:MAG: hypothetical protein JNK68_15895 [Betaproteobacteria bacterium]|nr:hypothetical protein [Betaproteobacteria bacterium]
MTVHSDHIVHNSGFALLAAGLCTLLAHVPSVSAEDLPKQGSFAVTYTAAGALGRTIDVGDGTRVVAMDNRLIATNDAGQGIFHNATGDCIGVRGGETRNGYCVFTDKDGDKFVEPWSVAPGAKKGTATLGPGTGNYKGIEGNLEWEVVTSLPAASGTYNFIGKKRGTYRLP